MKTLARSTNGAVYVEFLITFLPLFFFFLCTVQYMFVQTSSLIVQHAAYATARAAVVVIHDDPKYYDNVPKGQVTGKRRSDIERAAQMVLKPLNGSPGDMTLNMKSSYSRDERVEVKLQYRYTCKVPFARYIACPAGKKVINGVAALENQGADYDY